MNFLSIFRSQPTPATAEPVDMPSRRRIMPALRSAARFLFGSADTGRLTGDWPTMPQPAEWIINRHQRTLVARSREQAHNNDYMKAYLRLCRQNIVGAAGVMFQSKARTAGGKADKKAQQAIERWFKDWGKRENCDVAGKLSWRAMQAHCVETAARDGEFFLRMIRGKDGGKYGFALQVLDPQRCPVDLDEHGADDDAFVRSGIKFNKYGRPIAYAFTNQDPSVARLGYTYAGRSFDWIPAGEVIHGFVPELVGQKRGLPWLATGLFRMKQMGAFEDAAVVNARIGAAKMGFIQYADGFGPEANDEPVEIDAEAGSFVELPEGASLNKFDPTYPSGEFAVFMKQMLRSLATGGGVTYHTLAQDLEGVNFSSIRQGTLDEREFYMERQEWLIEELCDRVVEAGLERALLAGHVKGDTGNALKAENIDRYSERSWQARRWSWIDPRADAEAESTSKNNLMKSPGQIIRERGEDPDTVFAEIAADIALMKAHGIPDNIIEVSMGLKLAPPKPDAPKAKEE